MAISKKIVEPTLAHTCVAYDAANGQIVHVHRVFAIPGAREVTRDHAAQRTKEEVAKRGNVSVEVLHVSQEEFNPRKQYTVDISSKRLIESPRRIISS
jgi:hypothetical protein